MRPARIRHGKAVAAKDSVPENHEGMRIRRRARTSGTTAPDAPGVSGADARDDGRAIPPDTSMEKIMNQHAAAQTFERRVPADLDLDMSRLTIVELVTAFEGLRTLSHVTSGILGQPRCRNGVEKLFNGLWERLNWEWDKAVKEVKTRVPANRDEKEARDYAIVANSIDQNSPIDECLADAALACAAASEHAVDQHRDGVARLPTLSGMKVELDWVRNAYNEMPDELEGTATEEQFNRDIDRIRDAIFLYRPRTMAEVAEKATVLLEIWDQTEGLNRNRVEQLFHSLGAAEIVTSVVVSEEANRGEKAVPDKNSFSPAFDEGAADRAWENTDRQPSPPKAYNLHDLHSDVHHLHELLGAIKDILHEMSYVRDGKRDVELDRVAALNWIATDHALQLANLIEEHYGESGSTCADWKRKRAVTA